jgi:hypothetical protein
VWRRCAGMCCSVVRSIPHAAYKSPEVVKKVTSEVFYRVRCDGVTVLRCYGGVVLVSVPVSVKIMPV